MTNGVVCNCGNYIKGGEPGALKRCSQCGSMVVLGRKKEPLKNGWKRLASGGYAK